MSKVFLRMEKAEPGMCYTLSGDKRCYFHDGKKKRMGKECECCGDDIVYIQDTIIPQKLALYEEMLEMLKQIRGPKTQIDPIIDRAKKIEEATQ